MPVTWQYTVQRVLSKFKKGGIFDYKLK